MSKIFDILTTTDKVETDLTKIVANDGGARDLAMLKALELQGRPKAQKNLKTVVVNHQVTRKTKVALALLPEWGPHIPPYNLARITALSRSSGFETRVYDINIDCYSRIDKAYWGGYKEWKWTGDDYYTEIHPLIEPVLKEYLEKIVEFAPEVMGFSIYSSSNKATTWMIAQVKQQLPNVKILVGGPQALQGRIEDDSLIDHVVMGEGESIFLDLLEKIESGIHIPDKFLQHDKKIRIDLDSLPYPDYTDLDLSLYNQNGVSAELSRGCVAKCQFCSETTFWRYRGRLANNILDEIEHQYKTLGITSVWFIDSLVNGNLKELHAFAHGIALRKIRIKWMGYSRCDERMDLAYIQDLAASGCDMLSFGVESGSQHVLDLMKKNVKREAVEQNLRDFTIAGIRSHTNWFVGFPGEGYNDVADTMTLMWRTRNYNVFGRSTGTCQLALDTPLNLEREKFGIATHDLAHQWRTTDYTNTIFLRLIRYKSVNIILNHLVKNRSVDFETLNEREGLEKPEHYTLNYDPSNIVTFIPYEQFDFNIIKIDDHPLSTTVVNEIWPLLRVLWLALGPYDIELHFDPEVDTQEFGRYNLPRINSYYKADYKFKIDVTGNWIAEFNYKILVHKYDHSPLGDGNEFNFEFPWQGQGNWIRPSTTLIP